MVDKSEAQPLRDIINKVISSLNSDGEGGKEERLTKERIGELWRNAAGRTAGRHSRPVSLRKGKLVVVVGESSFLYDLTLRKKEILKNLSGELGGRIKEIQFRIGDTSEERPKRKREG